ncbi:unnamed protein product [Boreogadus saida]
MSKHSSDFVDQRRSTSGGESSAPPLGEYNPFLRRSCRTAAELPPPELPPAVRRRRHGGERDCTPGAELPDCRRAPPAGLRQLRRVYSGS